MNDIVRTGLLFLALTVAFSGLLGCGYSASDESADPETVTNDDGIPTGSEEPGGETTEGYPPAPAKIASATFKMLDGKEFNLEKSKGKVILINLWATWCGPCRKEMPELVAMQERYRDSGFEIIGLDTDPETSEEIEEFAEKMNLNYRLGWADREMVAEFFKLGQMSGIPQSFLIDRKGRLTGIFQGGSRRVVEKMKESVENLIEK